MDGKYTVIPTANIEAFRKPLIELVQKGTPEEALLAQMMMRTVAGIMSVALKPEEAIKLFKEVWDAGRNRLSEDYNNSMAQTNLNTTPDWSTFKTEL